MNRVQLKGSVTFANGLRYSPSGTAVKRFHIEVPPQGNAKYPERVPVLAFGSVAEQLGEAADGDEVTIEGELQFRRNEHYQSDDGKNPYMGEVIIRRVNAFSGKALGAGGGDEEETLPF